MCFNGFFSEASLDPDRDLRPARAAPSAGEVPHSALAHHHHLQPQVKARSRGSGRARAASLAVGPPPPPRTGFEARPRGGERGRAPSLGVGSPPPPRTLGEGSPARLWHRKRGYTPPPALVYVNSSFLDAAICPALPPASMPRVQTYDTAFLSSPPPAHPRRSNHTQTVPVNSPNHCAPIATIFESENPFVFCFIFQSRKSTRTVSSSWLPPVRPREGA